MTTMPTWAVWVLAFGTVVLGPAVSGVAAWFSRQAARNQDVAARRTEHGLTFRWACDRIASHDETMRLAGVATLTAMLQSGLLEDEEKAVLLSVGHALLEPILDEPDEKRGLVPSRPATRPDIELAKLVRLVATDLARPADPAVDAVADTQPPAEPDPEPQGGRRSTDEADREGGAAPARHRKPGRSLGGKVTNGVRKLDTRSTGRIKRRKADS